MYNKLTSEQRYEIYLGIKRKWSISRISREIEVSASTVLREIRRNSNTNGEEGKVHCVLVFFEVAEAAVCHVELHLDEDGLQLDTPSSSVYEYILRCVSQVGALSTAYYIKRLRLF